MADEILREDAKNLGYVKKSYGYGNYAKEFGILTRHDIATIRIHERQGEMDALAHRDDPHEDDL